MMEVLPGIKTGKSSGFITQHQNPSTLLKGSQENPKSHYKMTIYHTCRGDTAAKLCHNSSSQDRWCSAKNALPMGNGRNNFFCSKK